MKTPVSLILLAIPALAGEMREVATHEQLSEQLRISEHEDPMNHLRMTDGEDPAKAARPADLLATSETFSFNGLATLVPKGSVLAVPAGLQDRTGLQPGARIVPWHEFLARNRGWITTAEITFDQAAGRAALPERLREQLAKSASVVVATLSQGPISVNPHQPVSDDAPTNQASIRQGEP